jgi:F0F1-type ATP synthase membrane subunit a
VVAPIALTTFVLVLLLNAMDFLPVDIVPGSCTRSASTLPASCPRPTSTPRSRSRCPVFAMMIFYIDQGEGLGGWIHELFCAPFGSNILLWPFNLLFNASSTCRSRCRTRCGCTATCTPARSSSCCSPCGRRPAWSARLAGRA